MIKLINKKNGKEIARSEDSIQDLIKEAKKGITKDLFVYRRRVSFDFYTVEIWNGDPVKDAATAEYLFDIEGASRKMIAKAGKKLLEGKPVKKPDFKPKEPKPPKTPKPVKDEPTIEV